MVDWFPLYLLACLGVVDPVVREAGQRAPGAAVAVQQLHLGPGRAARHQDGCGEEDFNDVKRTSSEDTSNLTLSLVLLTTGGRCS